MYKTYKYRLYPNKTQEKKLIEYVDICCALYMQLHYFVEQEYKQKGKSYSRYDKFKIVGEWRKAEPFLRPLSNRMARHVAERLHSAYEGFFRRVKRGEKPGYPKPPNREKYNSFGVNEWANCKITKEGRNGKTKIAGIGEIRTRFHRPIEGEPKTWEVVRKPSGKWYICFACKVEAEYAELTDREVGIDLGLNNFVTTSDGRHFAGTQALREKLKQLRTLQKGMSRKSKGSNRWREQKLQVARLHENVANHRRHLHHNVANSLIEQYDLICVEDLKTKNMLRNKYLALSISDVGWSAFLTILENKAAEAGKMVVRVSPQNTSQTCSDCGRIVKKSLAVRVHRCSCGLEIDRDINAARNILQRGRERLAA